MINRSLSVRDGALTRADFLRVAGQGFGDPLNAYAHTMAWYQDRVYIGTTRANLCLIRVSAPDRMRVWPVSCPPDIYDLDLRAQIWSYDPAEGSYGQVFSAPMVQSHNGQAVPRELGYRGMAVFQAASDAQPSLYVSNWPTARSGRPPVVLRTSDGRHFAPASALSADPSIQSFRSLVPLNGCLYTAPTGRSGGSSNVSYDATVLGTSDPVRLAWSPVNSVGFGDPGNATIFEMASFNGCLYAATLNPVSGFQLWKCRPDGQPPYSWSLVLRDGAYRGNLNESVCSMTVFKGALYLGTGIQNGGYDRAFDVGPAAAELVRVYPDDSWDLVVGQSRHTPQGFKASLSSFGPGFDDIFNGYIWRLTVHNGWLYAGTYNWRAFLPYLPLARLPANVRRIALAGGFDSSLSQPGGFHLWRSRDGLNWDPITMNGFENPYNYGIRTMVSTPYGLCVGTANPFGPTVAVPVRNQWEYVPNPAGGLEVWLGKSGAEPSSGIRPSASRIGQVGLATSSNGHIAEINQSYDDRMYRALIDEYYNYSDFFNFGLWYPDTQSQAAASENLVDALLSYIPQKTGTILDVACGKGATTRHLLRYYPAANVTGINISESQLESCRKNAPACTFMLMDATQLGFADGSFDALICVEAAFHFKTRARFFREAYRVLKPGGRLVLSDILMGPLVERLNPLRSAENYLAGIDEYRALLAASGFRRVGVFDSTAECKDAFYRNLLHSLTLKYQARAIDQRSYLQIANASALAAATIRTYLLSWAIKA